MSEPTEVTGEVVERLEPKVPPLDIWEEWYWDADCKEWLSEIRGDEFDVRKSGESGASQGLHIRIAHVHDKPKTDELAELLEWMMDDSWEIPPRGPDLHDLLCDKMRELREKRDGR